MKYLIELPKPAKEISTELHSAIGGLEGLAEHLQMHMSPGIAKPVYAQVETLKTVVDALDSATESTSTNKNCRTVDAARQKGNQMTDQNITESAVAGNPERMSQATVIGLPAPESWDDFERGCVATFHGGHRTSDAVEIFQHGMDTVFNLLRHEFPPAPLCKMAPTLLAHIKQAVNHCETCIGEHDYDRRCARCKTFLRDINAAEGRPS